MKPEWKQFLVNKGAEFDGETLIHFGNPERERRIPPQGAVLCDLSLLGLISASGIDAQNFLQNQLSNDIRQVTEQQAQLSAYSSPKGRAYAVFGIFQRQGVYYLSLPQRDILETVLKRLRMFVMRSQVALEDAHDSLVRFGYIDPNGEKRLQDALGHYPEKDWDVLQVNNLTLIRHPASVPRFEICGELDDACRLWDKLQVNAAAVGIGAWRYFDIAAGIPVLSANSMEAWVPQMLNLHLINGISFTKGCYPGQEIVARLKYLGKNKRQTYRLLIEDAVLPEVGTTLKTVSGEEAGQVLNAAFNPNGDVEVLAVLKIAATQQGLQLGDFPAKIIDLPYELEGEEATAAEAIP